MPVIAQIMPLMIDMAQWTNWRFLFNVAVHSFFCSGKSLFFHRCKNFFTGLVNVVNIQENANGNENRQYYWSNNNVVHGSPRRYFFHKTKVVRLVVLSSCFKFIQHNPRFPIRVSTIRGTKLKVKTRPSTLTKIKFPQINCNVKETQ